MKLIVHFAALSQIYFKVVDGQSDWRSNLLCKISKIIFKSNSAAVKRYLFVFEHICTIILLHNAVAISPAYLEPQRTPFNFLSIGLRKMKLSAVFSAASCDLSIASARGRVAFIEGLTAT